MSLRTKTLMVVGLILLLMLGLITIFSRSIILEAYLRLERDDVRQKAAQAQRMVENELEQIKSVVGDWAPWDETYEFIAGENDAYIEDNLSDSTLINLPVDFMLFTDTQGNTRHCKFLDPLSKEDAPCPESLLNHLGELLQQINTSQSDETLVGVTILTDGPALVAGAPILTSRFTGPSRGTLLAGRLLTPEETERLAEKINLSLKFYPLTVAPELPAGMADRLLADQGREPEILALNDSTIASYSSLADMQGRPLLMLAVDMNRAIFGQAKKVQSYLFLATLATGLLFVAAALLFLERSILKRLIRLNREVEEIGATGSLERRVSLQGKDELAGLMVEINKMLQAVQMSTERDKAILETIEDGYFEFDLNGNLTFSNNSLARLLGYSREELDGRNYQEFLSNRSGNRVRKSFARLFRDGTPIRNLEATFITAKGQELHLEASISEIREGSGKATGFRGIARDITERKRNAEMLYHLAYHDSLTGLKNRKAFGEDLTKELAHATRYRQQRALLFIDLDRFKQVNDTFGHDAGDQLLVDFAAKATRCLRATDHLYRLGGDEFAIIDTMPENQSPQAIAKRILEIFETPFTIGGQQINFVSTSIGISTFPFCGNDSDGLRQAADVALYRAKESRNAIAMAEGSESAQ